MVSASALAGYLLFPAPPRGGVAFLLVAGVFLLAAGCSALNQVQERVTDALMARTCRRPVACGLLSPRAGAAMAAGLLAAGLFLLALSGSGRAVGLGLFACLWYNGVYTGLKRRTPFATLPGALCGAIPPMMGWSCAGGALADYRVVLLAGILVLWQLPHFWLLALSNREELARAGFPPLFPTLPEARVRRIVFVWICSAAVASLSLGAFGLLRGTGARFFSLVTVCWLCAGMACSMVKAPVFPTGRISLRLTLFMGLIVGTIIFDRLLSILS